MQNNFPKILIGSPTSSTKAYCFEEWLDNVLLINYPGEWKVVLFDNSEDNGESVEYQNAYYRNKYGDGGKFECIKSDTRFCTGLRSRLAKSHNDVRKYAIDNGYGYLLHLESDVLPKPHFLQELLLHKKPVVGALYYRDFGRFRKLMVQKKITRSPHNTYNKNFDPNDDIWFVDGTLRPAAHIGLGCVLIRKDILERFPFRFDPNVHAYPDTHFAEDITKAGIKIWADTNLICEHRNQAWDIIYSKGGKA